MNYRVCTLDSPDNDDNDCWATNDILELSEQPSVDEVCKALKACGRMGKHWKHSTITLMEDGDNYYVCHRKDGKKGYLLRRED